MITNIESRKVELIAFIALLQQEEAIRENVTVEDLIKEQNWQPIDENKIDAISNRLNIKEPIELLLSQLKP